MKIVTQLLGKRFNANWLFRERNYIFESGKSYAILGANGSGKSTFLQILLGYQFHSEGSVVYHLNNEIVKDDDIYKHISFTAPYIQLIEEYTLKETIEFHFKFKEMNSKMSIEEFAKFMLFENRHLNQLVTSFSSGMLQRLKLGLALNTKAECYLLDEPLTNLDKVGEIWYKKLISTYTQEKIVIVASNYENEFDFCEVKLNLQVY